MSTDLARQPAPPQPAPPQPAPPQPAQQQQVVLHVVGHVEEIPLGEGRAFTVDGRQVAVFRHRDGRLSAVDAVCPHAAGPLADGQIDDAVVVCPLHLNAWDLATGASRSGQAPVAVHPCSTGPAGEVVVTLPS